MLWALTGVDNRNAMFLGVWRSRVVVIRRKWCLRKKPGRLYWREISGPAWGRVIWPMQRGRTPRQCGPKRGGASRRSFFFISFFSPRPNLRRSTHHVPHSSTNPPGVSGSFFLFFTKIFRYLNGRSMAFRLRFANQRDAKGRRRSRRHGVGSFIQKDRVLCFYFLEYLSASSLFWFFI